MPPLSCSCSNPLSRCEGEQYPKPPALTRLNRADGDGGFYFPRRKKYKGESGRVCRGAPLGPQPDTRWARPPRGAWSASEEGADYGVGRTAAFPAIVTAPIRATALPFSVAPVFRLID